MSFAVMHDFRIGRNHAGLAVHAAKETIRLLQKTSYIPEADALCNG